MVVGEGPFELDHNSCKRKFALNGELQLQSTFSKEKSHSETAYIQDVENIYRKQITPVL
jgi:hypothetical protein